MKTKTTNNKDLFDSLKSSFDVFNFQCYISFIGRTEQFHSNQLSLLGKIV